MGKKANKKNVQASPSKKKPAAAKTAVIPSVSVADAPQGEGAPTGPGKEGQYRAATAGEQPDARKLFLWFFLALLLFSLFLLYHLMEPFLHTIILACVFSALAYPLYQSCLGMTGNRRIPAAALVLLCITLLGAGIVSLLVVGFIPQAKASIAAINQWLGSAALIDTLQTHLEPHLLWVQQHFPEFEVSIKDIRDTMTSVSTRAGHFVVGSLSSVLANTVMFVAHTLLMLLIMFFLLIDGKAILNRAAYLLPLKPDQTSTVMESLRRMSRAVLVGGFSVAVLQGFAGGIGFSIVGIPGLFWGAVMVFAALVPVVGTGLVWVPALLYLFFFEGDWQKSLILLLWCGVGVTSIDSFLRPFLMRGGADVPVLFIFLSILGGINVFGMLGLLYGPMILGLVAVMLHLYAEEYHYILEGRIAAKRDTPAADAGVE